MSEIFCSTPRMQVDSGLAATDNVDKDDKESSVEDSTKNAIDLSDGDTPSISLAQQFNQIQAKGKKRMTAANRNKYGSQESSTKSTAQTSEHKLLKVIKKEK